jgi:predicted dehydrogenase
MTRAVAKSVGVVGAGDVSFKAHLPLLTAMGISIPWIIDSSRGRAQAAAEAYAIPHCLDADELDRVTPTDVVLLTCPYGVRQPYFEFFRDKPVALYVEKPVARTEAELAQICALRAPYQIAAGFLRRSMGVTNIMRGVVKDRLFGRLRRVRSEFGTITAISTAASFAKDAKLAGGGQLIESAIHNIDVICFMAGITSARVHRSHMVHENNFDLHTEATIGLLNAQGDTIEMELIVTCFRNTKYEIEMEFDHAVVTFSVFKPMLPRVRTRQGQRAFHLVDAVEKDYPRQIFDVAYVFWSEFLNGLEHRRTNYTNAATSAVTTSIIEQLYQGAHNER